MKHDAATFTVSGRGFFLAAFLMAMVITISNALVQFPLNDWLTLGAFTYPFVFLVTDVTNRTYGAVTARRVVAIGFVIALLLSIIFVDMRIGLASVGAYLCGQLLDITIFARFRSGLWWRAPLYSSIIGSALDSIIFFTFAFVGTGLPWLTWGIGDFGVKLLMAVSLLPMYKVSVSMWGRLGSRGI